MRHVSTRMRHLSKVKLQKYYRNYALKAYLEKFLVGSNILRKPTRCWPSIKCLRANKE